MLTAVAALHTTDWVLSPSRRGALKDQFPSVTGRATMSSGRAGRPAEATGGQAGCRGRRGHPGRLAPQILPQGPRPGKLTVFLIEELLHLLPKDHLLPESVGIIFIYKRKTWGHDGWHGLGHCTCSLSHVAPLTLTGWSSLSRSHPLPCSPLRSPSIYPSIHPIFSEQLLQHRPHVKHGTA